MKKHSILTNAVGFLLAIIIVILGIAVPVFLLNKKEAAIMERTYLIDSASDTTFSNTSDVSLKEQLRPDVMIGALSLYEKLFIFENGIEDMMRAPFDYELNMEDAVKKARDEIRQLISIGAIPNLPFEDYAFEQAELVSVSGPKPQDMQKTDPTAEPLTKLGKWTIVFSDVKSDGQITTICDSVTGKIYVMQVIVPVEINSATSMMLLEGFAQYHQLIKDDQQMNYSEDETALCIDDFLLDYFELSQTASFSAYIISIGIKK